MQIQLVKMKMYDSMAVYGLFFFFFLLLIMLKNDKTRFLNRMENFLIVFKKKKKI